MKRRCSRHVMKYLGFEHATETAGGAKRRSLRDLPAMQQTQVEFPRLAAACRPVGDALRGSTPASV